MVSGQSHSVIDRAPGPDYVKPRPFRCTCCRRHFALSAFTRSHHSWARSKLGPCRQRMTPPRNHPLPRYVTTCQRSLEAFSTHPNSHTSLRWSEAHFGILATLVVYSPYAESGGSNQCCNWSRAGGRQLVPADPAVRHRAVRGDPACDPPAEAQAPIANAAPRTASGGSGRPAGAGMHRTASPRRPSWPQPRRRPCPAGLGPP